VKISGQSVLVTGASGFIGGHVVRRLIGQGCRVSCLVRASLRGDEVRATGAQVIACDIGDSSGIAHAIRSSNARVVFHVAGLVRALDLADFLRVNAGGVEAVAQACIEQVDRPVLVLVSSLAAVGPSGKMPMVESDSPQPVSDYGRSKLAGEQIATSYADRLPITIVRPGAVFGAGDRGMLEVWKPIARAGLHVVGGRGEQRLSLVAVADLVECVVLAAEQGERVLPGVAGSGVYFAAAEDLSHVELGRAIARSLGMPPPRILRLPNWALRTIGRCGDATSWIRRRPGWVGSDKIREVLAGSWTCSSAKAREQLGWLPAAPIVERIRDTTQWYRDADWI
jgi:dihydroflavonol-4-reductase